MLLLHGRNEDKTDTKERVAGMQTEVSKQWCAVGCFKYHIQFSTVSDIMDSQLPLLEKPLLSKAMQECLDHCTIVQFAPARAK